MDPETDEQLCVGNSMKLDAAAIGTKGRSFSIFVVGVIYRRRDAHFTACN